MSAETDHTYPYSHIFIGKEKTIAICGSSVFVLNSESGSLLSSVEVNSSEKNILPIIRVAAVDSSYEHLVTSGDDKRLRVWSTETLEELSSREVPKRANELKMTHDGQTILAADKFGDIFSYSLIPSKPKAISTAQPDNGTASSSKSISVAMHDNPEGTLILGHASIITAFILTPDERLVVSADRDEHIRVSWYPEGWDVEKYCMGHKKFVSALEIPSCAPSILLSGGGDPELHVWDYRAGQLLTQIPVWEQVRPFIKVRGGRKQWKDHGEGKRLSKGKGKGKKGKGKADDTLAPGTDDTMDTSPDKQDLVGAVYDDEVLVVSHIRHARLDSTDVVIFSAVGASALFYFQWPSSLNFAEISVQSIDLLNPVTGIIILDNQIWVSVDPSWAIGPGAVGGPQSADQRRLRLLVWKDSTMIEAGSESHLLKSLNETCAIKGSSKDIQALDLYDPLIALPKIAEPESLDGSMDPEESGTPVPSDITSGPGLRASARQKVKEQLEKRKAMAQDLAQNQKNAKQPRVEGP